MLFSIGVFALDVPIIFVQEQKSEGVPLKWNKNKQRYVGGWATWYSMNPDGSLKHPTVMTKIIGYKGYQYRLKVDNSPAITCDININTESSSKSDDLWIPPGLYDEPSYIGCCLFSFGAGLVGYEIYKSLKDTTKKDYYPRFGIGISYSPGIAYTGLLSRHLGTGELDPFCNLYWNNRADICILYFLTSNWAVGIGGGYMWTELWNRTPRFTLYYPPKWEPWILDSEDSYWILSSVTGIIKVKYLLSKGKMGYLEGGLEYYYLKGESHGEFYQGYPAIFFTGESFSWARGFGGFLGLGIYKSILWNIELDISIVGRYGMAKEYKYEIPEGTEPELAGWPRFLTFYFSGVYLRIGIQYNLLKGGKK